MSRSPSSSPAAPIAAASHRRRAPLALPLRLTLALLACVLAMALSLPTGADAVTCSSIKATRVVPVSDTSSLKAALADAKAGDRIDLAAGTYTGNYVIEGKSGTADKPIVVCGPRSAVFDIGNIKNGYGIHLNKCNHWQLLGFTVTNIQKGIMLDESNDCLLSELLVYNVGMEAVHFRKNSCRNRIEKSEIHTTGRVKPDYGEGVYIGSAKSNLVNDNSDFNQVVGNHIGPDVTAEGIDIKEYSSGGLIADNVFDGKGMSGKNYADSWIDCKGNGYYFLRNKGTGSLKDGIQTHDVVKGWGSYNVFDANEMNVNGPGMGIETASNSFNIVRCNNKVSGAKLGLSNLKECSDEPQTNGRPPATPKANWPDWKSGSTAPPVPPPTPKPEEPKPEEPKPKPEEPKPKPEEPKPKPEEPKPTPTPPPLTTPPPETTNPIESPADCSAYPALRVVKVSTTAQLTAALSNARPGDRIELAAGTYSGTFKVDGKSGTRANPITLCGPRNALLDNGNPKKGYGLHLNQSNFWRLVGFTVKSSSKGIMLDESSDCLLSRLEVHDIGLEGVHFRTHSARNRIELSHVHHTGRTKPNFGEGVYIGSAKSNLVGDASHNCEVVGNIIGPQVTAEGIDVKEYSVGGLIAYNTFDGRGISGENSADSWIDVKGNGYWVVGNSGTDTLLDGMQTHSVVPGWGSYNVFDDNEMTLNSDGQGVESGWNCINIVRCNNRVSAAKLGASNVPCGDEPQTRGGLPGSPSPNWPAWKGAKPPRPSGLPKPTEPTQPEEPKPEEPKPEPEEPKPEEPKPEEPKPEEPKPEEPKPEEPKPEEPKPTEPTNPMDPALPGEPTPPVTPPSSKTDCASFRADRVVPVSNSESLQAALAGAKPGDRIDLAAGRYTTGRRESFVIATSGTAAKRIVLCGSSDAILDVEDLKKASTLLITGASYWDLIGFSVTNGERGVEMISASNNRLQGLRIFNTGREGVLMTSGSSSNTIFSCEIRDTGVDKDSYGDAVTIGSNPYKDGTGDACNGNQVLYSRLGPGCRGQSVEIHPFSLGGAIVGNVFDARGQSGRNYANAFLDLKGNGVYVAQNRGSRAIKFGVLTRTIVEGTGSFNVFDANTLAVLDEDKGVGFECAHKSINIWRCNNMVRGAKSASALREGCADEPLTNVKPEEIPTDIKAVWPDWETYSVTPGVVPQSTSDLPVLPELDSDASEEEEAPKDVDEPTKPQDPTTPTPTPTPTPTTPSCAAIKATRVIAVSSPSGLQSALWNAKAGDRIDLAPGVYSGRIVIEGKSGTSDKPITLCGTRDAIIDGGSLTSGYALHLNKCDHWRLQGFAVRNGQKGIMLDESNDCLLSELLVHDVGMEAVHFRTNSKRNRIELSEIHHTGRKRPEYGEGVYIGSAKSNLKNDNSDYNEVVANFIGPEVTAEGIDIKEYSSSGLIADNVFDGRGMSGKNYADSWIDVKGNGYLILRNKGTNSLRDGFQTHDVVDGWGSYNVFDANELNVNGPGYGLSTAKHSINIVRCNNKVKGAALGLSDLPNGCSDNPSSKRKDKADPLPTVPNWPAWGAGTPGVAEAYADVMYPPPSSDETIPTVQAPPASGEYLEEMAKEDVGRDLDDHWFQSNKPSGMSTGTLIAILVPTLAVAAALAAFGVYWFLNKRRVVDSDKTGAPGMSSQMREPLSPRKLPSEQSSIGASARRKSAYSIDVDGLHQAVGPAAAAAASGTHPSPIMELAPSPSADPSQSPEPSPSPEPNMPLMPFPHVAARRPSIRPGERATY